MAHPAIRRNRFLVALFALLVASPLLSQEKGVQLPKVDFQQGPITAKIGEVAEIKVPQGFVFTGSAGTQSMLESMQNPVSGNELGLLASKAAQWFVVFEFREVGYVKDDDKDSLDAAAMLEAIRKGNENANEERKRRGWAVSNIVGWEQEPRYNPQTNNLEWAIRGESEGSVSVNYNTRLLGRKGVMEVNLVVDPDGLKAALSPYKELMTGFSFIAGEKYSEYRSGDKIAQFGLAALVTGGAAAVALKTGILQKAGKLIIAALVGLAALVKSLFTRKRPVEVTAPSENP